MAAPGEGDIERDSDAVAPNCNAALGSCGSRGTECRAVDILPRAWPDTTRDPRVRLWRFMFATRSARRCALILPRTWSVRTCSWTNMR